MRRLLHLPFFFVALLICMSCSNSSIDKANDLIKTGAFDQAIGLLDKEIQNNPKNDKAFLAMANCLASKYADIMIKGIKEEGLFGDALAPAKEALKRKAIDYYNGTL